MNVVETYVTNITKVEKKYNEPNDLEYYEIIADTDCYGVKKKQTLLHLLKDEYDSVMKNGYYLT